MRSRWSCCRYWFVGLVPWKGTAGSAREWVIRSRIKISSLSSCRLTAVWEASEEARCRAGLHKAKTDCSVDYTKPFFRAPRSLVRRTFGRAPSASICESTRRPRRLNKRRDLAEKTPGGRRVVGTVWEVWSIPVSTLFRARSGRYVLSSAKKVLIPHVECMIFLKGYAACEISERAREVQGVSLWN